MWNCANAENYVCTVVLQISASHELDNCPPPSFLTPHLQSDVKITRVPGPLAKTKNYPQSTRNRKHCSVTHRLSPVLNHGSCGLTRVKYLLLIKELKWQHIQYASFTQISIYEEVQTSRNVCRTGCRMFTDSTAGWQQASL